MKIVSRVLFFDFKAFLIKTFYYIRTHVLPPLHRCLRHLGIGMLGHGRPTPLPSVCLCPPSVFPGVVCLGFGTSLGRNNQLDVAQHLLPPWRLEPGPSPPTGLVNEPRGADGPRVSGDSFSHQLHTSQNIPVALSYRGTRLPPSHSPSGAPRGIASERSSRAWAGAWGRSGVRRGRRHRVNCPHPGQRPRLVPHLSPCLGSPSSPCPQRPGQPHGLVLVTNPERLGTGSSATSSRHPGPPWARGIHD